MESTKNSFEGLFSLASDLSRSTFNFIMDFNEKSLNAIKGTSNEIIEEFPNLLNFHRNDDCSCCPPKHECPPQCLAAITRNAYKGERIVVPFKIKNVQKVNKHYRVGVRTLKDDTGNTAPSQPALNRSEVTLQPGESEMIFVSIDLVKFETGHTYNTNIVIREKDINQNVCLHLNVLPYSNIPESKPWSEKRLTTHFQGWQSHFYCDSPIKKG